METAMHAARLVAAHSALLALLIEQQGEQIGNVNGITVSLATDDDGPSMDVMYTANGSPVAGEGL